jgi:phospholipid/cholesterol/gamma-HCH transport system substrate-binding protein
MKLSKEQLVGLFFLGGVVLFVFFVELTVGTGLFSRGRRLWAEFHDVQGLGKGAQVRVSGVRVGAVREVLLEPGKVRVGIDVQEDVAIREDAIARLDFQALSGTRFVAIEAGSPDAKALGPGATIRSEEPAGISQMVDELKGVATSIRVLADSLNENQDRLLTNVNAMIEENRETFGETLANLNGIAEKLNKGEGTLGRLLSDPMLYDEATATLAVLRESFGDIRQVTGRLAEGRGTIGRLLQEDDLYDDLRETLASLDETVRNLEEVSGQIRLGQGTLGRLLVDDALYDEAEGAVKGLTRATQGIEDQAPISVLGTLIGTIF